MCRKAQADLHILNVGRVDGKKDMTQTKAETEKSSQRNAVLPERKAEPRPNTERRKSQAGKGRKPARIKNPVATATVRSGGASV